MINYYKANIQNANNYDKAWYLNRTTDFQNIKMPVLVIHGEKDQYQLTEEHNNTWKFVDKDLTIKVLSEAGHFIQHDESAKVTKIISQFIKNDN